MASELKEPMRWRRTLTGLVPNCERSQKAWERMKPDDECVIDMRRPRNLKHSKKLFVLLKIVKNNSDDFSSVEMVLLAVKAALGRGQWIQLPKASRPLFVPESIAFESMDQDEFERFYVDALNVVVSHFLPGMTSDQLDAIIMEF